MIDNRMLIPNVTKLRVISMPHYYSNKLEIGSIVTFSRFSGSYKEWIVVVENATNGRNATYQLKFFQLYLSYNIKTIQLELDRIEKLL